MDPILDAPITPAYPVGYAFWIQNWHAIEAAARQWYEEANGHPGAETDIGHGLWRGLNEGDRWKTLRNAFQDTWPKPVPPPVITPTEALRAGGLNFTLERNGQPIIQKICGFTAFDAPRMFLQGRTAELAEFAAWSRAMMPAGVQPTWRMFTMWQITNFRSTPESRAALPELVQWCYGQGIRPWLVTFCDQTDAHPNVLLSREEQDAHAAAVHALRDGRLLIEEVNEYWQNGGAALSGRYDLAGIPNACRSTPQDGDDPRACGPLATFTNDHTPRDDQWHRKFKVLLESARLGGETFDATDLAPVAGEPKQINTISRIVGDDEWGPRDAADYYAGCELYGSGGIVHDGDALKFCRIPTDAFEQRVLEAIRQSWGVVPAHAFAQGAYSRDDLNQVISAPGAIKNYAMILGNTAVAVCPSGQMNAAVGVDGWRIVDRRGYEGRVAFLER